MGWNITFEGEWMLFKLSGIIDVYGLMEFARAGHTFEMQFMPVPDRLTDMSDVSAIHLDKRGLNEMALHRKSLTFPNQFKSAIVAPALAHYGFAKMFQTLNNHPQIEIKVFQKMADAQAWLKPGHKAN